MPSDQNLFIGRKAVGRPESPNNGQLWHMRRGALAAPFLFTAIAKRTALSLEEGFEQGREKSRSPSWHWVLHPIPPHTPFCNARIYDKEQKNSPRAQAASDRFHLEPECRRRNKVYQKQADPFTRKKKMRSIFEAMKLKAIASLFGDLPKKSAQTPARLAARSAAGRWG